MFFEYICIKNTIFNIKESTAHYCILYDEQERDTLKGQRKTIFAIRNIFFKQSETIQGKSSQVIITGQD